MQKKFTFPRSITYGLFFLTIATFMDGWFKISMTLGSHYISYAATAGLLFGAYKLHIVKYLLNDNVLELWRGKLKVRSFSLDKPYGITKEGNEIVVKHLQAPFSEIRFVTFLKNSSELQEILRTKQVSANFPK